MNKQNRGKNRQKINRQYRSERRKKRQKIDRTNSYKWLKGYNTRLRRRKLAKLILTASVILILLTAAVTLHLSTGLRLPRGTELVLIQQEDDTMLLLWPSARGANAYDVKVTDENGLIFEERVRTTQCVMPMADQGKLHIQVQPVRENTRLGNMTVREGNVFHASCELRWPQLTSFRTESEEDGNSVSFIWSGQNGNCYLLFRVDEEGYYEQISQDGRSKQTLLFGDKEDYPLPDYGETYSFVGCCGFQGSGIILCSTVSDPVLFERSDFAGEVITLEYTENGDNVYTFTWNEAKGDYYELQYRSDYVTEWTTIQQIAMDAGNTCTVRLNSGTNYRLQMVGVDKEAQRDGEYAARSPEVQLTTGRSITYATIWPQKDLTIYSDVDKKTSIGTAKAATAYCVLEETEGMFRIHTENGYGYVDSTFCMINLPDYLGELCFYDITNSYSAIFTVHGYDIPEMTGTVIPGFDEVHVEETGPDEFLVPLLYPTAQKLYVAAQDTLEDGLRLKIYEAYRPREASTYMYRTAERHLYDPLPSLSVDEIVQKIKEAAGVVTQPSETESSASNSNLEEENILEGFEPEMTPVPEEGQQQGETAEAPQEPQPAATPETEAVPEATPSLTPAPAATAQPTNTPASAERGELTYYDMMTGGQYRLGSFLARNGSTHNLGIAVDITLIDSKGNELNMQTKVHDLSYYATTDKNNESANRLRSYMTAAGFNTLVTEWWHFQDDNTRYGSGVRTFLEKGVSPEGWTKDDQGWKYRNEDGSYILGKSAEINGQSYTFDANGYAEVDW